MGKSSQDKIYSHNINTIIYMDDDQPMSEDFQRTEVNKIDWLSLQECLDSIRPYNLEKKEVITKINRLLQEYNYIVIYKYGCKEKVKETKVKKN